MAFVSLAIIALVAFASPFIASAIPGKPVPETVFLLVLGAVLGPHMLGVIHVDAEVSLVSELGLAFLFLLAGFEIDPKSITGVEGRYGLATWAVTFGIAWLAVRFTPWFSVSHFDGIAVTLALTSTALGTLVPIMRERSLTGTRVGDSILAYGTWGELGP
ncbi:MAG: cation:proton antiporter, partial [Collinsella sp.]